MNTDLTFIIIGNSVDDDFIQCMNIYREAFPVYEQQADEVIAARVGSKVCTMIAGKANGEILCMAIAWDFVQLPFAFLDYFAVSKQARGKRVGSAMLDYLIQNWIPTGKSMIIEVEHPEQGSNQNERRKRIAFYGRRGAVLLENITYYLPPLGGADQPMEMRLMIVPDPARKLDSETLKTLIKTIYEKVYGKKYEL